MTPQECQSIDEIRNEIDKIDRNIIELISKRAGYVNELHRFKKNEDDVYAKQRYDQVFEVRREWANELNISPEMVEKVYKIIVHYFIDEQLKKLK